MKVSGFSFIRNALMFDYPIVEDGTLELVKNIDPQKIRIVETNWDDSLREGGIVLAQETDKAFRAISPDADWAFYIQGDEVFHENGLGQVMDNMKQHKDDKNIDGLLFDYLHFYGSYRYVGESWRWYRKEIRVVRNSPSIYSYRDAQGFRKGSNQKLLVKPCGGTIHHYGWVKPPVVMQQKQLTFNKLWHKDNWVQHNIPQGSEWNYHRVDALRRFEGTHPAVMFERIGRQDWDFEFDTKNNHFRPKEKLKRWFANLTGHRLGEYKNYILKTG
jgi:hypothetical protein